MVESGEVDLSRELDTTGCDTHRLLHLAPKGDTPRVEAANANDDVGLVEVGERVKLKLAAYSFQKYGLLECKIVRLIADAQEPEAAARATGALHVTPPLKYKTVIELDSQSLLLPAGGRLPLAPGMAATAQIHQGARTASFSAPSR